MVEGCVRLWGIPPRTSPSRINFRAPSTKCTTRTPPGRTGATSVTNDQRFILNASGIPLLTDLGLADLGITEQLEPGPVGIREERIREVQSGERVTR